MAAGVLLRGRNRTDGLAEPDGQRRTCMKKSVTFAFLGLVLLLALALPASATLLATGTREAFSSDINTAGYTTLALDDAGNTTLNFTSGSGPVQIAYSAECAL